MTRRLIAATCLAILPLAVQADATLLFHDSADESLSTVQVKDGVVRMDVESESVTSLFDSRRETLTVIDHEDHNWYTVTARQIQEQVGEARDQLRGMAAELEREMAGMSPEQRRMMEQFMGQSGIDLQAMAAPPQAAPTPSVHDTGRSDRIAGIRCAIVEARLDGRTVSELCVARGGALSIPAADRAALEGMFKFMEKLSSEIAGIGFTGATNRTPAVDGIPVRIHDREDGSTSTLREVSTKNLDAALFRVPAGYRQIDPASGD